MNLEDEQGAVHERRFVAQPGRRWLGLVVVAVAAAMLLGLSLGSYSLWDPDESKHAEVAREMLETGNWIEPQISYQPYHHKPSFLYLLIGGVYRYLGVGEWQARLVPVLAGWLTLLAVYWYSSAISARRGVLAAVLLASSPMFVGVARFANFDGLVTLFTGTAVLWLAAWLDRGKRGSIIPFYMLVGLGVLAKGPMAAVVTLVPVVWLLWRGDVEWRELRPVPGMAVMCAVVGCWAVPVGIGAPQYLFDFVWIHNIQRYLVPQRAFHPEPFYFFVPVILAALLPWSLLLPWVFRRSLGGSAGRRFLAAYSLWVVLFFSFSSGKLATYVLPAFPAMAVLGADWLGSDEAQRNVWVPRLLSGAAVVFLLLPVAGWAAAHREAPGLEPYVLLLLPAAISGGWLLAWGRSVLIRNRDATIVLCAGMLASLLTFNVVGGSAVSSLMSDADLAAAARAEGRPDRVVAYGVRPYSFLFYTRWPIVYQVSEGELRDALRMPGQVLLLTKRKRIGALLDIAGPLGFEEVAANTRHLLLRVRPLGDGCLAPCR